ncbi:MAG: class I SAM-dependent methyltransferase, partial [Thermoplasmata archaeon]|nr:class I SAM-dependent methyltransferase [Thermoplasmata archaeon]
MADWFQTYVMDTYSQIAHHFDKTRHGLWPEIRWYASLLPPGSRVLDIGSGNGRNAIYLASLGHKVIGVDVVPEMVDVANKRAAQLDLILEFVVGDARELAFEEEMDGVVCIAALHHLPSPEDRSRAMEELWRVLKPGGIGLVSTWAREQARFATAMPVENDAPEGDVLIPWTRELDRQVFQRYYHMYARGEFEMLVGRSS